MHYHLEFEKPIAELHRKLEELRLDADGGALEGVSIADEVNRIEKKLDATRRKIFSNLTAIQRVQLARHPERPFTLDYLRTVFHGFLELRGDRLFADDRAMVGGFARLEGERVVVVGTQKGRDTKEKIRRNFGSAHPDGYRKALRLMRLAAKFGLPIVSIIDTAGAYPGIGAEERHIAEAIAVNLREMMLLEVPVIALVIGEGGSGGALGIGVADRVLILENAYYSVISPEGCASILWKDRTAVEKAAKSLKITASDLLSFGLVDRIIPEPLGGAHRGLEAVSGEIRQALLETLAELREQSASERMEKRYRKFRSIGRYLETAMAESEDSPLASSNSESGNNGKEETPEADKAEGLEENLERKDAENGGDGEESPAGKKQEAS